MKQTFIYLTILLLVSLTNFNYSQVNNSETLVSKYDSPSKVKSFINKANITDEQSYKNNNIKEALNPDGSVKTGLKGSYDAKGYKMFYGNKGQPIFKTEGITANGWDLTSTKDYVLSGDVNVIAIEGSDIYVGGSFTHAGDDPNANFIAVWRNSSWYPLGTGLNNTVNAILILSRNEIYVGGSFTQAGGTEKADRIAKWDGSSWVALGDGLNNTVTTIALNFVNNPIVGGSFTDASADEKADYVARWAGDKWVSLVDSVLNGPVYTIAVDGLDVYVGGAFTKQGFKAKENAKHIVKWDGISADWDTLKVGDKDCGLNNDVYSIAIFNTNIYIGGLFTKGGDIDKVDFIVGWKPLNEEWFSVIKGLNGPVKVIKSDFSTIYIAGNFTNAVGNSQNDYIIRQGLDGQFESFGNGVQSINDIAITASSVYAVGAFTDAGGYATADYIAKWNFTVGEWRPVDININEINGVILSMAVQGDKIYVGGKFTSAGGNPNTHNIAFWDGNKWNPLRDGLNDIVTAIAVSGSDVYVGGDFTDAGGNADADCIARWDGNNWNAMAKGLDAIVTAIAISGSDVYVGGFFLKSGDDYMSLIARWDGNKWNRINLGLYGVPTEQSNGKISGDFGCLSILIDGNMVYFGGSFDGAVTYENDSNGDGYIVGSEVQWAINSECFVGYNIVTHSWFTYGSFNIASNFDDIPGVYSITKSFSGEQLIITGNFNIYLYENLITLELKGLNSISSFPFVTNNPDQRFYSVCNFGSEYVFAGRFSISQDSPNFNNVVIWDGNTTWQSMQEGQSVIGSVAEVVTSGSDVFIGGDFSGIGNVLHPFFARWVGPYTAKPVASANKPILSDEKDVDFDDVGIKIKISKNLPGKIESPGNGIFNVYKYEDTPLDAGNIENLSKYRWIITQTGLASGFTGELRIKWSTLNLKKEEEINPASVAVYVRSNYGKGKFRLLNTKCDVLNKEIVVNLPAYFAEFALAYKLIEKPTVHRLTRDIRLDGTEVSFNEPDKITGVNIAAFDISEASLNSIIAQKSILKSVSTDSLTTPIINVTVSRYSETPNYDGYQLSGKYKYDFRWLIESTLSSAPCKAVIRFKPSLFLNKKIIYPDSIIILQRSEDGVGTFLPLPTVYDTTTDSYLVTTTSFGEFTMQNLAINTVDTLARFDSLGTLYGAINGYVHAIAVSGKDVYVLGEFDNAGNVPGTKGIARWDGNRWNSVGGGFGGYPEGGGSALAVAGNNVYVSGYWVNPIIRDRIDYLKRWDGNSWHTLGSNGGVQGNIYSIAVSGKDVYVGGDFYNVDGVPNTRCLARWDGSKWNSLGLSLDTASIVRAIAISGKNIYVGGYFSNNNITLLPILRWDGLKFNLMGDIACGAGYYNTGVYAIAISGHDVYVGGESIHLPNINSYNNCIARWDGSKWNTLGQGLSDKVESIAVLGSTVYVGGKFTYNSQMWYPGKIAVWDSINWYGLGRGLDYDVYALATSGSDIYIGGAFTMEGGYPKIIHTPYGDYVKMVGGTPNNYFTKWSTVHSAEPIASLTLQISPDLGLVNFTDGYNNTFVTISINTGGGNGFITVSRYNDAPKNSGNISGYEPQDHRWVISASGLASDFSGTISIDLSGSEFNGIHLPNPSVIVRETTGYNDFVPLQTVYDQESHKITAIINHFSEFVLCNKLDPLPIELSLFTVKILKKRIELNWQTLSEVNNYGFDVERKNSSIKEESSEWKKIGFVEGSGTSNSVKEYSFLDKEIKAGKYIYRLKQIDNDGAFKYSDEINVDFKNIPDSYSLEQNYPNPFNPSTTIKYGIPNSGSGLSAITLKIYDILGREVATLVNEQQVPGYYELNFNASSFASGVYFYAINASSIDGKQKFSKVKKMILIK